MRQGIDGYASGAVDSLQSTLGAVSYAGDGDALAKEANRRILKQFALFITRKFWPNAVQYVCGDLFRLFDSALSLENGELKEMPLNGTLLDGLFAGALIQPKFGLE